MNNLAPMKNCPGWVQGNLNWMPGYYDQLIKALRMEDTELFIPQLHDYGTAQICS